MALDALGGRRAAPGTTGIAWLPIAVPGILFAGDILFWHWSITYTTVANATLLANLAPVIVTARRMALSGRAGHRCRFLAGMALAMGGAALLVNASATLGARYVLGDMLGVITACFFGSYVVAVARLRDRNAASTIMFYSSVVTCVLLLAATLISGESLLPGSASGWIVLLALAWISQAMGQGFIAYALGHLPASFSALAILIEPLTAADPGMALARRGVGRAASRRRNHRARRNCGGAPGEQTDCRVKELRGRSLFE